MNSSVWVGLFLRYLVLVRGLPVHERHVTAGLPTADISSTREEMVEVEEENQGDQVRNGLTQGNRTIRDVHCSMEGYYPVTPKLCCQKCPAGTHVAEYCKKPYTLGKCNNCTEGEEYTEWPNGLDECLHCHSCRKDEEVVSQCTRQKNTVCQCEAGRFCLANQSCEMCQKCKKSCPEGQIVKVKCSRTSDTVCGRAETSTATLSAAAIGVIVVLLVMLIFLCVSLIICHKKTGCKEQFHTIHSIVNKWLRKPDSADPGSEALEEEHLPQDTGSQAQRRGAVECGGNERMDNERMDNERMDNDANEALNEREALLQNSPNAFAEFQAETPVLSPSHAGSPSGSGADPLMVRPEETDPNDPRENPQPFQMVEEFPDSEGLRQSFSLFVDVVPIVRWKEFMRRLQLTENQIVEADRNNAHNVKEGHYQMLHTWLQKAGNRASIKALLQTLYEMDLVAAANEISLSILGKGSKEH
ncbi:tumor necrosis factor receptor superfamily member 10A-like isoform X2 [Carcharodon carcharias]|uniref:tumor necrosis factor receptor superfamily member 10A-like isoform X2 n=1 Tax=Carcharodon carcharias TaxID=13397 RepID=UPI001B7E455E|nr:tumor necrosis factor receptor superfamily member 10A-like isoform X2 [Carcharodon carcharias]